MYESTEQTPAPTSASHAASSEAWRAEVDEIIASINPLPEQPTGEATSASESTLIVPRDDIDPAGSPEVSVAQTQPAAPCLSALAGPAPPHQHDEVTTPAHPIQQAALRTACECDPTHARPALQRAVVEAVGEVHRQLGPGLCADAYGRGLVFELALRGIPTETDVALSVMYKGRTIENAFVA